MVIQFPLLVMGPYGPGSPIPASAAGDSCWEIIFSPQNETKLGLGARNLFFPELGAMLAVTAAILLQWKESQTDFSKGLTLSY